MENKEYFCYTCKQKKLSYLFFKDIKTKKEILRDRNGKLICFDCKLDKKLERGYKMKSRK